MPSGAVTKPVDFTPFDRCDIDSSIWSRFERIVSTGPERLAVKTPTEALTYDALKQSAARISQAAVEALGPSPQPIALLLGQSAGVVAAVLGVLRAGHYYVPCDLSWPEASLRG